MGFPRIHVSMSFLFPPVNKERQYKRILLPRSSTNNPSRPVRYENSQLCADSAPGGVRSVYLVRARIWDVGLGLLRICSTGGGMSYADVGSSSMRLSATAISNKLPRWQGSYVDVGIPHQHKQSLTKGKSTCGSFETARPQGHHDLALVVFTPCTRRKGVQIPRREIYI